MKSKEGVTRKDVSVAYKDGPDSYGSLCWSYTGEEGSKAAAASASGARDRPDQRMPLSSITDVFVGKQTRVLQAPVAMLKNTSAGNQAVSVVEMVRRIFNLRP